MEQSDLHVEFPHLDKPIQLSGLHGPVQCFIEQHVTFDRFVSRPGGTRLNRKESQSNLVGQLGVSRDESRQAGECDNFRMEGDVGFRQLKRGISSSETIDSIEKGVDRESVGNDSGYREPLIRGSQCSELGEVLRCEHRDSV